MNTLNQLSIFADHHGIRIDMILGSIVILALAFLVISYLDRLFQRLTTKGRLPNYFSYETLIFVTRLVSVAMWIGIVMLLLHFWGISVTGLWTVMVSMAAVVGVGFLAVWTMISNITASVFLTIWRPFHMGADVELLPENMKGRVVDRNMMYTVLREKETESVLFVPNNLFFQKVFRVSEPGAQHMFDSLNEEPTRVAVSNVTREPT